LLADPYFTQLGVNIPPEKANELFNKLSNESEVIDVLEFTAYVANRRLEKQELERLEVEKKKREEREEALGK